ncbi:MAG: hypothetical protein PWR08_1361 [Thermoanaerobacterium sp.]|nr:hypothetical protein [Thermoanaerobacterium sp.]
MTKEEFIQYEKMSRDTIDVKRIYIDIAGDIVTGVLLSQIVFYYLPDDEGKTKLKVMHDNKLWLAKTREDWWKECRISPKQFDRSIKILENKKIVTTKIMKFNGNPTKHICLNLDILINEIEKFNNTENKKDVDDNEYVKSILPKSKKPDKKPISPKEENGFLPKGKIEIDQKGNSITEKTTEITNRDPVPDSVYLVSNSSDNKLVNNSKISLENQSVLCSDTKIDNLSTYNPPKDTVSIIYNKPDISLDKTLSLKPYIEPDISLKAPVIEPDISFDKLDIGHNTPDRETATEPVNKPVVSTVTMLEDRTGKILNNNLNKPINELDVEPEESIYASLVKDGFVDPFDPDDPFRDIVKNMPPHVEYTDEELEEILKKLNAGSSLNDSYSEKKSDFERSGKILNSEQNKPKKDLFKLFSFSDFFGTSDKVVPDISRVLANKKQNEASESETGKILNNSLNKPEKDLNNALDMPNDAVKEPDAINVDDLDDDFLKLDDELFESEEYKEFFAMLDAMPNPDDASKASLEMSYSELDRELKTVSNQKPDTSLNAPEEKLERNVIMPDDALSEFDSEPEYELESALSEPVAMNTAQSLQKDNNLQECPFAEDTNSFTSAAGKINCDTDRYGLHLLDKARKIQEQRNIALDADNDADLMLHHFVDENSAQCLESVPEGKEVSYSYGNWSDYAIEETDDDGTIISSGQFKQDCDVFENLDDDWKAFEEAGFTVIDELDESNTEKQADIDDDWRVFEEAGFMVVDELDASSIKNAEQQADAENELAKMLEEAFNARIVDRTENDIVSVMSRTEKHVDNTESEFEKMLEEAFDAKIVYHDADSAMSKPEKLPDAETNNPEELPNVGTIKPVDEPEKLLDEEVDKALTELKKVPESQVLNEHEKMLDAEVGETINEPEEMPDAETGNEHEKLSKAKVVSLVDRLEKLPNSEIGGFANKPEKMLKYGTNKALSELEKSLKAKTVRALSRLDRPAGISHSRQNRVIQECHISSMFTSAVKKEKATGISCIDFGELELAVNAGIRKQWKTVRGSPPVKANCIEIFKNLFAMSRQKHRNFTFACEGGILK